jgi:hypothetical protein
VASIARIGSVARRASDQTDLMEHDDTQVLADAPSTLAGILEPDAALAAARRMQRWYQTTPQGAAHSQFGRDGRRVEGRPVVEAGELIED